MRAHGNEGRLGKRFAILIGAAALGAAVMAAGASADFRSVHDPRGDAFCLHERGRDKPCSDSSKRNADIVRVTADHDGGRLKHTIRVVGKIKSAHLLFNTDSDPKCEWVLFASREVKWKGKVLECPVFPHLHRPVPRARVDFHRHSVEIVFRERLIGNPDGYGWSASTNVGPWAAHAYDQVRKFNHYIRHGLG